MPLTRVPPCDPRSNSLTQKEWLKVISMLVDTEPEDGLKRGAIMVVAKKIGMAHADLLYHKIKIFLSVMYSYGFNIQW